MTKEPSELVKLIPYNSVKAIMGKVIEELRGKSIPYAAVEALFDYLKGQMRYERL